MKMRALGSFILLLLVVTFLEGCVSRPAKQPMDSITDVEGTPPGRTLLVLLPGAYDVPQDYFTHGFARELRQRAWPVDIIAVDAHVDYYTSQTIVQRLHEDIITPARARGYARIWLAGISLGGFGSLLYVHQHPGVVQGVILLAPYLGARSQVRDIGRAGGLAKWRPRRDLPLDEETEMLAWLSGLLTSADPHPELYLGYGASDRFVNAIRVLAHDMPSQHVIEIPGGHDWPTWSKLWTMLLDRAPFGHFP